MQSLSVRLRQRYNESGVWIRINPILAPGEIGIESDTGKFKYGNGINTWTQLDYAFGDGMPGPIICKDVDDLSNYSAENYRGQFALVPREYEVAGEGKFLLDTPYLSVRKQAGRNDEVWIWVPFSDLKDEPLVSSVLGQFVLGVSPLG